MCKRKKRSTGYSGRGGCWAAIWQSARQGEYNGGGVIDKGSTNDIGAELCTQVITIPILTSSCNKAASGT